MLAAPTLWADQSLRWAERHFRRWRLSFGVLLFAVCPVEGQAGEEKPAGNVARVTGIWFQ